MKKGTRAYIKIVSFNNKAIIAGNKFSHSLRRKSKRKNEPRDSIKDIRDVKELQDGISENAFTYPSRY